MKIFFSILLLAMFFNAGFSQVKSVKKIEYRLSVQSGKQYLPEFKYEDSCVVFWETYDRNGKILIEYDFPSDRCWQINGPWEHHYFYDKQGRLIEHRYYGGKEGSVRILMEDLFYSYPFRNDPGKANEVHIIYDYQAGVGLEAEQIDTIFYDTFYPQEVYAPFKSTWKFDTIRFSKGNFIFREDFTYNKSLFQPELLESLTKQKTVIDFEKALTLKIDLLSDNFTQIWNTGDSYSYEFKFQESDPSKAIELKVSEYFIWVTYELYDARSNNYLTLNYEYYIPSRSLKKGYWIQTYTEYYNE